MERGKGLNLQKKIKKLPPGKIFDGVRINYCGNTVYFLFKPYRLVFVQQNSPNFLFHTENFFVNFEAINMIASSQFNIFIFENRITILNRCGSYNNDNTLPDCFISHLRRFTYLDHGIA